MKTLTTLATHDRTDPVTLLLRATASSVFVAHSTQKLFGRFGANGPEVTGQWMNSIGLDPDYLMALLVGSGEFFGRLAQLSLDHALQKTLSDYPEG